MERGLINFMLDTQTVENNYIEIFPPFFVNSDSALTTGNLPKFSEDMYHSEIDNLWLIPTAEVPITSYHRDQILSENQLPKKYAAFSACFRREAGSYGKETRGLLRVHQFNKVELVQFVNPNESYKVLEELTSHAEEILRSLKLKYRKVELCSGDLSFSAAKKCLTWRFGLQPKKNGLRCPHVVILRIFRHAVGTYDIENRPMKKLNLYIL